MARNYSHRELLLTTYLVSLFYALHFAFSLYVESSFVSLFIPKIYVGLLYSVAALAGGLFVLFLSEHLNRFTNYRTLVTLFTMELGCLILLAYSESPWLSGTLFVLHQTMLVAMYTTINVYVEGLSKDSSTGGIRGTFLTILNLGILAAPLFAGFIFAADAYRSIFLMAALLLVPALVLTMTILHNVKEPKYKELRVKALFHTFMSNKNLRTIFTCQFLLEFFYTIMVIYTPIYLHGTMGIPLSKIVGVIMPIALIPFVIFPYELGRIADLRLGEKEILITGFVIAGLSTLAIPFISSGNIAVWALVLLITRIGASFIEAMNSTYFYKKIDGGDSTFIAVFDSTRMLALLVTPGIASLIIFFLPMQALFIMLGFVMLLGIRPAWKLIDTK